MYKTATIKLKIILHQHNLLCRVYTKTIMPLSFEKFHIVVINVQICDLIYEKPTELSHFVFQEIPV